MTNKVATHTWEKICWMSFLIYAARMRAATFAAAIEALLASTNVSIPGAIPARVNSAKITLTSVAPNAFATNSR